MAGAIQKRGQFRILRPWTIKFCLIFLILKAFSPLAESFLILKKVLLMAFPRTVYKWDLDTVSRTSHENAAGESSRRVRESARKGCFWEKEYWTTSTYEVPWP